MNWEAIGAVGEMLGAAAVIATLLYLATQIRQNTQLARAVAYQSITNAGTTMSALVVGDPDVARIWTSGLQGGVEELSREDWTRFTFLMRDYFLVFESVFMQHRLGSATDELFESRMETLRRFLQTAGGVRAWREVEHGFSRSYREHVAENILR